MKPSDIKTESITVFVEVPVILTLSCYPEYRGARDKYGQQLEPDEDAGCEIDCIETEDGQSWESWVQHAIDTLHKNGDLNG